MVVLEFDETTRETEHGALRHNESSVVNRESPDGTSVIVRINTSEGHSIDNLGICQLGHLSGKKIH